MTRLIRTSFIIEYPAIKGRFKEEIKLKNITILNFSCLPTAVLTFFFTEGTKTGAGSLLRQQQVLNST